MTKILPWLANYYAAKVINLQRTKKDFIKKFLPRELQVSCEVRKK